MNYIYVLNILFTYTVLLILPIYFLFNKTKIFLGRYIAMLDDHKGFVQGVAWDPLNKYTATLSSDR